VDRPRPLVLVAEDDPDLRMILGDLIRRRTGARVRIVDSGPAALLRAREEPPAAAVLDAGLPVMDGFEVARRLRADPDLTWTALIGLSGAGRMPADVVAAAGFDAFVDKRGGLGALVDTLRDLLAARGFAVAPPPELQVGSEG
jgi:two-component system, chemotaxis family, CheB/CheR fusion protein